MRHNMVVLSRAAHQPSSPRAMIHPPHWSTAVNAGGTSSSPSSITSSLQQLALQEAHVMSGFCVLAEYCGEPDTYSITACARVPGSDKKAPAPGATISLRRLFIVSPVRGDIMRTYDNVGPE
jgi:hypothetical protein